MTTQRYSLILLFPTLPKKENGQTADFSNLSALAPPNEELLKLWKDFLKVVDFINDNERWLMPLLKMCKKK